MRLLHTADWHVGRTIRGRSRADEHAAVLGELVEIAERESVDAVLVCGDQFDTSAPTAESERLVYRTLLELSAGGRRPVFVLSGNHDDPRRLDAVGPLLAAGDIDAVAFVAPADRGGVIERRIGGETLRLALLPWLSQRHVIKADELMGERADQHGQRYADRVRRIVGHLGEGFGGDAVNVVAGHATVVGGTLGGGEREVHTVFDYAVPATAFPPTAQYVALGHLHRTQRIDAPAPVWYSGSPLQLDFGEVANEPAALVVEIHPGTPAEVTPVPFRAGRRLRTVRAALADLDTLAAEDPSLTEDHLRIVVLEAGRAGLADDVRERFPNAVEVRVEAPETDERPRPSEPRLGRSPTELFAEYLTDRDVDDERLVELFAELVDTELDAAGIGGAGESADVS
ncbi:MAG: exonuclease subunit SbcD [Actinomycetota bacterium]|nr:exonuclease subunit SbcD [Actinomycetota bacterium]